MTTPEHSTRVRIACETCRKRKRKCDGVHPCCVGCMSRNIECRYDINKAPRQRRDPGYVTGLEDQLELLKDELRRLDYLRSSSQGATSEPEPGPKLPPDQRDVDDGSDRGEDGAVATFEEYSRKATPIQDVSSLIWRMSIEDTGEPAFIGPSGNECFPVAPKRPLGRALNTERSTRRSQHPSTDTHRRRNEAQITQELLDLFLDFINPIHFFLDQDTIREIRADDVKPELSLVKHAVMAAASLLADDEDSRDFGNDVASAVESVALPACRQYPCISLVQVLAIMCWRELGLENHNMAWMYNCMCASMTLHLGLPVSSLHALENSTNEDNYAAKNMNRNFVRISTAWSSLLIDRIATSLLGRNCMLPWRRVRAASYVDAIAAPSLCDLAFDSHCQLWFVHDQWMDKIYSFDFNDLRSSEQHQLLLGAREQLLSFQRNLDNRVQLGSNNSSPAVIVLHMTYNMSQILIHRPFLRLSADNSTFRLSVRAMSTAAMSMSRLIRVFERVTRLDRAPPFVPHSIMTAAVTHLLNATSTQPTVRSPSIRHFRTCFNALITMSNRWIKARRFVSSLQDLAQRWSIMQALPLHGFPVRSPADFQNLAETPHEPTPGIFHKETQEDLNTGIDHEDSSWVDVNQMNLASYQAELVNLCMPNELDSWPMDAQNDANYLGNI